MVNVDTTPNVNVKFVPVMLTSQGKTVSGKDLFKWARAGGKFEDEGLSAYYGNGKMAFSYVGSESYCEHPSNFSYI